MKKRSYINFKAIGISLIFLLNPNVGVIDFLPDFIGYMILCSLLVPLGDISDTMGEAISAFKRMAYIDACRIIAIFWVFGFADGTERSSSILLWAFTFGALEMIFLVPAFSKLFGGLVELGYLHDNSAVLGCKKSGGKNYTDKIRRATVFFVCFKAILSFLPEFSNLSSVENVGQSMYRYIGLMRGMAFIPVLIAGIVWYSRFVRYFVRVSKDKAFALSLRNSYEEKVLPKIGIFAKRRFSTAFALLIMAAIFSFDLRIYDVVVFDVQRECVNLLPDVLSAVFFALFFVVISRCARIPKLTSLFVCGLYLAASAVSYLTEWDYFTEYDYEAIYRSVDAMEAYTWVALSSFVSMALFAVVCLMVAKALRAVIMTHTGALEINDTAHTATLNKMTDSIRKELGRYLIYLIVASVIYVLTDIFFVVFSADYGFTLLVNAVGAVIFMFALVKAYSEISEAMHSRYLVE